VTRDSGPFRRWLDTGLRQARADLPKVTDGRGYYYLVESYVAGFRDSHIQFRPIADIGLGRLGDWPGFSLEARAGGYEVAYRPADVADAPPLHARLVACDGKSTKAFIAALDRYEGDLDLASNRNDIGILGPGPDGRDPFVPRANVCIFRVGGEARRYRLHWRPLDGAHFEQVLEMFGQRGDKPLGLAPSLDANDGEALRGRGLAELSLHDDDAAIADLTRAIAQNPKDGLAYRYRSLAYSAKKDRQHANSDDSVALRLGGN